MTILTTLTLKNAIWLKRATHDLKRAFCTIFIKSALFSLFGENWRPAWRFWQLWSSKMRFGQNVLRMTWKERFVQFSWKAHSFLFLKRIWGQCDDFDNFGTEKCNSVKTCCAWPEKSVFYNFDKKRTVFAIWRELEASMTILRTLTLKNAIWPNRAGMTWKEAFVQFSWKAPSFPFLERRWGQHDDFDNFDAHKYLDVYVWPRKNVLYHFHEKRTAFLERKTCYAWPGKSVLYNFHKKRTVFQVWREFETRLTILRNLMLKNAISPKRAAHDLKRTFCAIFMKSALFSLFGENLRPVWRFRQLWRSQMRFGQNVLRVTWKERFVQFSWKAHCFPVLKRIWSQCDDFDNFDAHKCDLAKTCCAWPEKNVL